MEGFLTKCFFNLMRLGYADGEWVCCRGGLFVGFNGTRLRLKVPRRNFNGTRLRLKVCDPSLLYGENP